jgi:CelD/BcsL family acetyltransferase involved in cellulose biosynthesis
MVQDSGSIKVIQHLEELPKLKDVWNSLAEKHQSHLPWLSWEWFALFLKYFMKNSTLFILLVYKSGEIAAIAPLAIAERKYKGLLRARVVQFISNMHSPVSSFIFSDSCIDSQKAIVERIVRYFHDEYTDWDVLEFEKIPEENHFFSTLTDAISAVSLKHRTYPCKGDWYLDGITYSFAEYFKSLPRIHRKDTNRNKRRLQDKGDLTFYIKSDTEELEKYLDLYSEVRGKSWKAEEKDSGFLREVTKLATEKGWLRLTFLFLNGAPIACDKWMVWNKIGYAWDGLYDLKFSNYSPGKVLESEIIEYMIDKEKVFEIDFGEGDEAYKKRWTPRRRERKGITVFNNNIKASLLALIMVKVLPFFEKQSYLVSVKKRISDYLKKSSDNDDNIRVA